MKKSKIDCDAQCRQNDLERPQPKQHAPQTPQAAWFHLQTDQKQQHDDANFGELAHAVDFFGDKRSRRVGSNNNTRDQQAQNGSQTEMAKQGHRYGRDDQQ